jgi:hypothetical protein
MKNLTLVVSILLIIAAPLRVGFCQQPTPATAPQNSATPDPHALKIRHQLEYIGLTHDVTVKLRHGRDYHGRIVAIDDDGFKIDEIDLNQVVGISYADTSRIDRGYSPKSLIGNHRRNPRTRTIASLVAFGGVMTMILLVVRASAK